MLKNINRVRKSFELSGDGFEFLGIKNNPRVFLKILGYNKLRYFVLNAWKSKKNPSMKEYIPY